LDVAGGETIFDSTKVPSRACFECEAKQDDDNFDGCTAEPWKAAGITLCKPWQVFCYKYNEVEFCKEINSFYKITINIYFLSIFVAYKYND